MASGTVLVTQGDQRWPRDRRVTTTPPQGHRGGPIHKTSCWVNKVARSWDPSGEIIWG